MNSARSHSSRKLPLIAGLSAAAILLAGCSGGGSGIPAPAGPQSPKVSAPAAVDLIGKMINTSVSCTPPLVQMAGKAAIENDTAERTEVMAKFHKKVELMVRELRTVDGVTVLMPKGTFSSNTSTRPRVVSVINVTKRMRPWSPGVSASGAAVVPQAAANAVAPTIIMARARCAVRERACGI